MDEKVTANEEMSQVSGELALIESESKLKKGLGRLTDVIKRIGKRNLAIAASVALIGTAVVLNFVLFGNSTPTISDAELIGNGASLLESNGEKASSSDNNDEYFASAQLSRKQARDQALAVLRSVVDSTSADKTAKEQASLDISRITTEMEAEANIETLVKSKGFEECIAVVGEGSASVIVRSDGLLPNELSQIKEIVWEQAGIEPAGIKIIEQSPV